MQQYALQSGRAVFEAGYPLRDHELGREITRHKTEGHTRWHVIANAYTVRILAAVTGGQWVEVGTGDLGEETRDELIPLASSAQLTWNNTNLADVTTLALDLSNLPPMSVADLKSWIKRRDKVTSGRQGEVSDAVKAEVCSLAAWRCQFEGCGENLRAHFMPGIRGNFSYLAHIVASSPVGPRGDPALSSQLANDAANILLLCDKCHRTIDRVAPHLYARDRLLEMRERNLANVERCLDSLRYPVARVLAIGGNVQGQSAGFDYALALEAMWLQRLRADNSRPDWFARNAGHIGDTHSPAYWSSMFALLKRDIPRLQSILDGTGDDSVQGRPLAVFPAPHCTSVLILTGRLLGEGRTIHLFQFHRDQVGGNRGGQWAWTGPPPAADKYRIKTLRLPQEGDEEATLLVYLTDAIPPQELPTNFFENNQWCLPTVEISVQEPSRRVICHPSDLELFGLAVDHALQKLQDQWRVTKVHLFVIAPITACVRIGQKMQARCQPDFVLHERNTSGEAGVRGSFTSTIGISTAQLTHLKTGETCPLF